MLINMYCVTRKKCPIYVVTYYIKWVTNSCTYNTSIIITPDPPPTPKSASEEEIMAKTT